MTTRKISKSRKTVYKKKEPCYCGSGKPYELCHLAFDQEVHLHSGENCVHCGEELIKDISSDWFIKLMNSFMKWHNYYKKHDLFKFSSVSLESMIELERKEKENELSKNDLFEVYVNYLIKENSDIFVQVLEKNDIFSLWLPIIKDAVNAHYEGKFTLSIPALFPVIEGLLRKIQQLSPSDSFKCNLNSGSLQNRGLLMYADSVDYFNKFVTKLFEGKADTSKFNRNLILHGITSDYYSEEHSLILIMTVFEIDSIYKYLHDYEYDISLCF